QLPLENFQSSYRQLFWSYYRFVKMFYEKNLVENLFLMTGDGYDELTSRLSREFTSILSGDVASPNSIIRSLDGARLTINPEVRAVFECSNPSSHSVISPGVTATATASSLGAAFVSSNPL
ncbi:MAG: hypothetical protein NTV34_08425, partial [Proteobacteria bacterium]|nr:hypothetical protein [Pseudomonadota bacterium]